MATTLLNSLTPMVGIYTGSMIIFPAILAGVLLFGLILIRRMQKKRSRQELIQIITERAAATGVTNMIKTSFYADGHPSLETPLISCVITRSEGVLRFGRLDEGRGQIINAVELPIQAITNIKVQDISTLKFKSPVSYKLSKSIFTELNETLLSRMAILTIEWKAGNEQFETRFGVHEDDAMMSALMKRNELFGWFKMEMGMAV